MQITCKLPLGLLGETTITAASIEEAAATAIKLSHYDEVLTGQFIKDERVVNLPKLQALLEELKAESTPPQPAGKVLRNCRR